MMTGVTLADLTPRAFAHYAAQLAAFAAGERDRRYAALRRARLGLTMRGTWLTDKGLAAASNGRDGEGRG